MRRDKEVKIFQNSFISCGMTEQHIREESFDTE